MTELAFDPDNVSVQDELQYQAVREKGPAAVARFIQMLEKGETVKMAAMLATQSPPTTGISDQIYQRNKKSLLEQFNGSEIVMENWKKEYKRKTGEELPDDAVVFRGLADSPGDPKAVLTHKNSLQDIKQAMKDRNVRVEGEDWEIEPVAAPPKVQEVVLADDIIARIAQEAITEDPDIVHRMKPDELRALIIEQHGRKVDQSMLEPMGCKDFKSLCKTVFKKDPVKVKEPRKKPAKKQATKC